MNYYSTVYTVDRAVARVIYRGGGLNGNEGAILKILKYYTDELNSILN